MPIINQYHGCQIASSDDQQRHEVVCNGHSLGSFPTLAEAIQAARYSRAASESETVLAPPGPLDATDEVDSSAQRDDSTLTHNNDPE